MTHETTPARALTYGLMGAPLAMLGLALYLYVPRFFAHSGGLSLASLGGLLLLTRLIDTVQDPWLGRRLDQGLPQAWRWVVAVALGLGALLLWQPQAWPQAWSQGWPYAMVLAFLLVWVSTCYSVLQIDLLRRAPGHGPALMQYSSAREAAILLGMVLAAVIPGWGWNLQSGLTQLTALASLLLLLSMALRPSAAPHQVPPLPAQATTHGLIPPWHWWQDRTFCRLAGIFFLNGCGNALPATFFLFYLEQVAASQQPPALWLGLYFGAGLLSLPLWAHWSKKFSLWRLWQSSVLLAMLGFSLVFGPEAQINVLLATMCVITGVALGADLSIPPALLSQHLHQHQPEQQHLYFGVWTMLSKLALAVAVGLGLPLWQLLQVWAPSPATWPLLLLYAGLPLLCKAVVFWALHHNQARAQSHSSPPRKETHHVHSFDATP